MRKSTVKIAMPFTIRPIRITDANTVAELAGELGYPSTEADVRSRIRRLTKSDLLLLAVNAEDRPFAFVHAHALCVVETGFQVEILGLVVLRKCGEEARAGFCSSTWRIGRERSAPMQ